MRIQPWWDWGRANSRVANGEVTNTYWRSFVSRRSSGQPGQNASPDIQEPDPNYPESIVVEEIRAHLSHLCFSCQRSGLYPHRLERWAASEMGFDARCILDQREGIAAIANGSDFADSCSPFQTWQNVQAADIRFRYMGTTPVASVGGTDRTSFHSPIHRRPLGSSTIAVTFSFLNDSGGQFCRFDESDIVFNTTLDFSTSARGEHVRYSGRAYPRNRPFYRT